MPSPNSLLWFPHLNLSTLGRTAAVFKTGLTKKYYQPTPVACEQPVRLLRVVPLRVRVVLLWAAYGTLFIAPNFIMGWAFKY